MTIQSKSLHLLQQVTAMANEAESPDDALQFALDEVCRFMDWPIGHVYLPSEKDGGELISSGLWHLENPRAAANFCLVTETSRFASGVGLPGRVLESGKPAWISNVQRDPNFPRAKLTKNLGVKAGFAFPVLTGHEVVGVLEFFSPEAAEPDESTLKLMANVGTQLGRAIERDRSENARREREGYIQAILDNLVDGVITIDGRGRIEEVNPAVESIFGYSSEELVGQSLTRLMPEAHGADWSERMGEYMEQGRARFHGKGVREVTARRRDGREFPMELTVSEFKSGERNLFIGVVRDLTARKQQELELQQAQRLEAVGQLTGGIAHDFNNVLTALLGNLQIVEGMVGDNPQAIERVRVALNSGQRAAETTRRLLAFSRRQPVKLEYFDANDLLEETLKLVRQTLAEDIEIETTFANSSIPVLLDKGQFENAVINLAVNARDAMDKGGTLKVETGLVDLAEGTAGKLSEGTYARVAISDAGIGMSQEVQAKVFEPFFTTKEVGKGTGLGLSMVYGFAHQAGGDIRIASREGEGTTVEILLPVSEQQAKTNNDGSDSAPISGGSERVLVVEDDAGVREFACSILESLGYEITEAENAVSALKMMKAGLEIDLLFSDVIMPGGLSGRDLAGAISARNPETKILLSTGYADELNEMDEAVLKNMSLLTKPYSRNSLALAVRKTLDDH